MKKHLIKHIGKSFKTTEGYTVTVVGGGSKSGYCTISLDGFEFEATFSQIKNGNVKNKLHPSVFGVGFIGHGSHDTWLDGNITKKCQVWKGMLERCYDPKYQAKKPTYVGCSVSEDWHNFQNFGEWFDNNYIDGYQLDKDKITVGNKTYSESDCCFISGYENVEVSQSKHYKFTSPSGDVVNIFNLNKFCRDNKLNPSNMLLVKSGVRRIHKGWTCV